MCDEKKAVGFIGLGIMGSKMAANLVKSGFPVTAHDIDPAALQLADAYGIRAAASGAEVAEGADVVITMLPDSPQVEAVVFREGGLLESMKAGSVLIDMSTIAVAACMKVSAALEERGVAFLDAPVTGGEEAARDAALSVFVGGGEDVFNRMLPLLRCMGSRVTRMGGSGMGQTAKICNQIVGAITLQAVCEGLILAAKTGMDVENLVNAMKGGAADSFMLEYVSRRVLENDASPGFKISLEQKDLRNALAAADDAKVPLPGAALVHQLFRSREAAGMAETEGNQALFRVYEQLGGFRFKRK